MSDIFISYSRRDSPFVLDLAESLRERGKDVWVDTEGLADAEVFPRALRAAIEDAGAFVFVISPDSASSEYCQTEVDHADELGKRIVPVLLHPVADTALPEEIRHRNWIPAVAEDAVERVVMAVETDRDHVHAHTRWTRRAVEWESSGREASLLPRGAELADGEAWLASCAADADPVPTSSQRELLLAARRGAARRQRRLLGFAAGAAVLSATLLVVALIARHTAVTQRERAVAERTASNADSLAARSDAVRPVSPLAATRLARAAVNTHVDDDSLRSLKEAEDSINLIAAPPPVKGGLETACDDLTVAYRPPAAAELALGSCDGTVHIVQGADDAALRILHVGRKDASTIAYRPDGRELAVLDDATLRLVDPQTGKTHEAIRLSVHRPKGYTTMAYSPDGRLVAVVPDGSRAYIVDLRTRKVRKVVGHTTGVGGVAFFDHGKDLVVGTGAGHAAIVDVRAGRIVRQLRTPGEQYGGHMPVAVSPDGRTIALGLTTAHEQVRVELWRARSLHRYAVRAQLDADDIESVGFSTDSRQLIVGTSGEEVYVVSLASGAESLVTHLDRPVLGVAARAPDLVTAVSDLGTVRTWRTTNAQQLVTPDADPNPQDITEVDGILAAVGPVSGNRGARVRFFARPGQRGPRPLTVAATGPRDDSLSRDGRFLLDTAGYGKARATIWDLRTRRPVRRLPPLGIGRETWSGTRIALKLVNAAQTAYGSVRVYDEPTGRLGPPLGTDLLKACPQGLDLDRVSQDGRRVVIRDVCGHLATYDANRGRLLRRITLPTRSTDMSISPDGKLLAIGAPDGRTFLRDTTTLGIRRTLIGHTGATQPAGFSSDGSMLVTVGTDKTFRVWRTADGALLRTVTEPIVTGQGVVLPDDRFVGQDATGGLYVYDVCTACGNAPELLRLAQPALALPLTNVDRALAADH